MMMPGRILGAALAAPLFVVAACNSSEDAGDGDAGDRGSVASVLAVKVCEDVAKRISAFWKTCAPDLVTVPWSSPTECEPRYRDNCVAVYDETDGGAMP
jgi:hypothetical protein